MAHKEAKWWGDILHVQYMVIWAILLGLTLFEVIIPKPEEFGLALELSRTTSVLTLIFLALVKTLLVAGYYMHLIGEKPAIIPIAAAPFLFATFLTIGIFPYY